MSLSGKALRHNARMKKLDSSMTPSSIDLIFLDSEGAVAKTYFNLPNEQLEVLEGKVSGIYELKRDDLKICFPDTAKTRGPRISRFPTTPIGSS